MTPPGLWQPPTPTTSRPPAVAVRFAYEWRDGQGQWFRSPGNENWAFAPDERMRRRIANINDITIDPLSRLFHWPLGRRPDDHPGLSQLNL